MAHEFEFQQLNAIDWAATQWNNVWVGWMIICLSTQTLFFYTYNTYYWILLIPYSTASNSCVSVLLNKVFICRCWSCCFIRGHGYVVKGSISHASMGGGGWYEGPDEMNICKSTGGGLRQAVRVWRRKVFRLTCDVNDVFMLWKIPAWSEPNYKLSQTHPVRDFVYISTQTNRGDLYRMFEHAENQPRRNSN